MSIFRKRSTKKDESELTAGSARPRRRKAVADLGSDLLLSEGAPHSEESSAGPSTTEALSGPDRGTATPGIELGGAVMLAGEERLAAEIGVPPSADDCLTDLGRSAADPVVDQLASHESPTSPAPKPQPKPKRRKVRTEADRTLQRQVAQNQRLRHAELVKTWMPSQRGANMTLATRIGSQVVEGWFKRTFVRLSRMLYRIHTFPLQHIAPDVIRRIESEVLAAIARAEAKISQQIAQCDEMLERVGARLAYYSKHFELDIIVSTKTAMALHAIYHRADELFLRVESLDFAGVLTDAQRQKQIGAIHAAIFGLAQSIERFHTGVYVRVAKATPEVAEVDANHAAEEGKPVDRIEEGFSGTGEGFAGARTLESAA